MDILLFFQSVLCSLYLGLVVATVVMSVQTTAGGLLNTFVVTVFVVLHPWTSYVAKRCFIYDIQVYDCLLTLEMSRKSNI